MIAQTNEYNNSNNSSSSQEKEGLILRSKFNLFFISFSIIATVVLLIITTLALLVISVHLIEKNQDIRQLADWSQDVEITLSQDEVLLNQPTEIIIKVGDERIKTIDLYLIPKANAEEKHAVCNLPGSWQLLKQRILVIDQQATFIWNPRSLGNYYLAVNLLDSFDFPVCTGAFSWSDQSCNFPYPECATGYKEVIVKTDSSSTLPLDAATPTFEPQLHHN